MPRRVSLRAALQKVEEALRIQPRNAGALLKKGRIMWDLDRISQAWDCFTEAAKNEKTRGDALLERATISYATRRDGRRALRDINTALRYLRDKPRKRLYAHRLRARILGSVNRGTDAMASYRIALQIDPNDPETLSDLGGEALAAGRPAVALRYLEQAIRSFKRRPSSSGIGLDFAIESQADALIALDRKLAAFRVLNREMDRITDPSTKRRLRNLRKNVMSSLAKRDVTGTRTAG